MERAIGMLTAGMSIESVAFIILFSVYIYIYIYMKYKYTHSLATLLGTLLVPGWTPFCLQNCFNSLWHRFNKMLKTFLRDFGPYWHDSIMQLLEICRLQISRSTTSQRYSIGLRSCDCGGHFSKVNVQETSLRWFELCDMVHYPAGSSHQKMSTL